MELDEKIDFDGRTGIGFKDLKKAVEMGQSVDVQAKKLNRKLEKDRGGKEVCSL